jgi:hypothetical protein
MAHEKQSPSAGSRLGRAPFSDASLGCTALEDPNPPRASDIGSALTLEQTCSVTFDHSDAMPVLEDELTVIEMYLDTALDAFLSELP